MGIVFKAGVLCAGAFLVSVGLQVPVAHAQQYNGGAWRLCLNRNSYFSVEDVQFGCAAIVNRKESPHFVAHAYHLSGVALHKAGQTSAALDQYDKAVNALPNEGEAYLNRGYYLHWTGRVEQALPDYDEAIALGGSSAHAALYWRATIRIGRKEIRAGLADFDTAIELAKESPRPNYFAQRAWAHYSLGNWDKALADFSTFLEWNPQDPEAIRNRGYALQAKGDYREAAKAFDKAIELKADHVDAQVDRALNMIALGQVERAMADLNGILAKEPTRASAHSTLARVLAAKGDTRGALDHHAKAVAIDDRPLQARPRNIHIWPG
jgi:tetratricopeptide (TPR) repeat protein